MTAALQILKKSGGTFAGLQRTEVETLYAELAPKMAAMFGSDATQMARFTETAIRMSMDAKLANCDAVSVIVAAFNVASMGLSINPYAKEAYIVPYGKLAQLQIGYAAYKKMAYESGVSFIFPNCVFEGDEFEYAYGVTDTIRHVENHKTRIFKFVYVKWVVNGVTGFKVYDKQYIENLRRRNKSQGETPSLAWATDYDAMAMAKAIKQIHRYVPTSGNFSKMAAMDESVMTHKVENGQIEITPHEEVDAPKNNAQTPSVKERFWRGHPRYEAAIAAFKAGNKGATKEYVVKKYELSTDDAAALDSDVSNPRIDPTDPSHFANYEGYLDNDILIEDLRRHYFVPQSLLKDGDKDK
jgi:recombination protein RecT